MSGLKSYHRFVRLAFYSSLFASPALGEYYYAAPTAGSDPDYLGPYGDPHNDGRAQTPWDLQTALDPPGGTVQGGDTIWLRGGTYTTDSPRSDGVFASKLRGDPNNPIIVRSYPGEWAVIKVDDFDDFGNIPILHIEGSYTRYWGFEITSSETNRTDLAPDAPITRQSGILLQDSDGVGVELVHLVIHDARQGIISQWAGTKDLMVYGNILYYNGWRKAGNSAGSGTAIYVRNSAEDGAKTLEENIVFSQFRTGIKAYSGEGGARADDILLHGNIVFNSGAINTWDPNGVAGEYGRDLLLAAAWGAPGPATDSAIINNYTWYTPRINWAHWVAGRASSVVNPLNLQMRRNYLVASGWTVPGIGSDPNDVRYSLELIPNAAYPVGSVENNTFVGPIIGFALNEFADPNQENTQYDPNNLPTENVTVFRTIDRFEPRVHFAVYNWEAMNQVIIRADHNDPDGVGLSDVLAIGAPYEIYDVQSFSIGDPNTAIAIGTYQGTDIALSLDLTEVADPVHDPNALAPYAPPHTAPDFAVFVLISPDYDRDKVNDRWDICPLADCPGGVHDDGRPLGDSDGDCDVDLSDFAQFAACYNGSARPPPAGCAPGVEADLDDDGDVDLDDFAVFASNYSGGLE